MDGEEERVDVEEEEVRLEGSMNVNCVQAHSSAAFYAYAKQSGEIASNSMVASNIENDASLAQYLYMVGNATLEHGTLRALRSQVDGVRHPAGSSFTQYGDMNEPAVQLQPIAAIPATNWRDALVQIYCII